MKKLPALLAAALFLFASRQAAALDIFTCDPALAALAGQIGGSNVSVFNAVTAKQDPHFLEARPSLIAAARRADLVFCVGADIETGWLPLVLRQSGNSKIQQGARGYLLATSAVNLVEIPARLDRAEGDVHPMGNPHVFGDPRVLLPIARQLSERLAQIDPSNAATYGSNLAAFTRQWTERIAAWEEMAKPLRGVEVVVQHRLFSYLINWIGMKEVGSIEPKPGVQPGAAYLAELIGEIPKRGGKLVLIGAYENPALPRSVSERAGLPLVQLPYTVGGTPDATDLAGIYESTINRLLTALQGSGKTR